MLTRFQDNDVLTAAQGVGWTGHWLYRHRRASTALLQLITGVHLKVRKVAIDAEFDLAAVGVFERGHSQPRVVTHQFGVRHVEFVTAE